MFTIRNLGGASLFLFGTTFAWITPEFVTAGVDNSGVLWFTVRILALITAAGFTVATWGLFRATAWWERLAITSAIVGAIAIVLYWLAAYRAGELNPWFTALILALGCTGVLILLRVPRLERWVDSHVTKAA
jgi:hypothetical protein